jgi:LacI family transcriptional regulator
MANTKTAPRVMRFRMADVASQAGVSLATVDRVLNGRGVVRRDTREAVLEIARRLGYVPTLESEAPGPARFDVILQAGTNGYLQLLADEIELAAKLRPDDLTVTIHRIEGFSPEALAAELGEIEKSDGLAVIALDHPLVREAIRDLRARGIPVATLVSDMSNIGSIGYVGIDNRAAGRLAGQLLGRLVGDRRGGVILFLGYRSYRGHEERETSFRHVLDEEFPHLAIVEVRDTRDDIKKTRRETLKVLQARNDIVGIYNIAAGNRGIAEALTETGQAGKVVFVAHELTEHSRKLLLAGVLDVAIDQSPRREAREVLKLLWSHARGLTREPIEPVPIIPVFRENIP